jgi:hypothetical protein
MFLLLPSPSSSLDYLASPMLHTNTFLAALCTIVSLPLATQAADLVIFSDVRDAELNSNGGVPSGPSLGFDGTNARAGSSSGAGRNAVFPFLLPTLPAGDLIASTSLNLRIATITGGALTNYNGDLYAIGVGDTATFPLEYYAGPLDTTDATLIMDNFTPVGTQGGTNSTTNASASATLGSYLQDLYSTGNAAGRYLYLRVSPDYASIPSGNSE